MRRTGKDTIRDVTTKDVVRHSANVLFRHVGPTTLAILPLYHADVYFTDIRQVALHTYVPSNAAHRIQIVYLFLSFIISR